MNREHKGNSSPIADAFAAVSPWSLPKTARPGILWPAVTTRMGAAVLALEFQLERSQWFSPEVILSLQLTQLRELLRHAFRNVPYYRNAFAALERRPGEALTIERWRSLPILTRADLQKAKDTLNSIRTPKKHGEIHMMRSSGSTGMPVSIRRTQICSLIYNAITLRDHMWHERDPAGKLVTIRHSPDTPAGGYRTGNWGQMTRELLPTGQAVRFHSAADIALQAQRLIREAPAYLLTYPSIVEGLARHFQAQELRLPGLKQVRTFGEALSPDVRRLCKDVWDVSLSDGYSAQEIGYMALQCPRHEHYHVQSESALIEIVDDADRPCNPGEVGRILVTPMHNYATPLIRYEIGDYAEVGESCDCGRGLPVLKQIIGRRRNLVRLPDGRMYRPAVGITSYREIAPVIQAQLVQHSLEKVEARLVVESPLTKSQEAQITARVQESLGHPFSVELVYVDAIERSSRDKFEDFLCRL